MRFATSAELPEVVERLRRCFAEAGFVDGVDGHFSSAPVGVDAYEIRWQHGERRVPEITIWRAREVSMLADPVCYRHWYNSLNDECRAETRLMQDCGA